MRIRRHLDSETVHLPELREFVGKDVEIIVFELDSPAHDAPPTSPHADLRGSVLRYDGPLDPVA